MSAQECIAHHNTWPPLPLLRLRFRETRVVHTYSTISAGVEWASSAEIGFLNSTPQSRSLAPQHRHKPGIDVSRP